LIRPIFWKITSKKCVRCHSFHASNTHIEKQIVCTTEEYTTELFKILVSYMQGSRNRMGCPESKHQIRSGQNCIWQFLFT
jgi:hypothetical protein